MRLFFSQLFIPFTDQNQPRYRASIDKAIRPMYRAYGDTDHDTNNKVFRKCIRQSDVGRALRCVRDVCITDPNEEAALYYLAPWTLCWRGYQTRFILRHTGNNQRASCCRKVYFFYNLKDLISTDHLSEEGECPAALFRVFLRTLCRRAVDYESHK